MTARGQPARADMHIVLQEIVFGLRLARRRALVTVVTIVTMMLGVLRRK